MSDYWDISGHRVRQIETSWLLTGDITDEQIEILHTQEKSAPDSRVQRLCSILLRISDSLYSPIDEEDPQALSLLKKRNTICLKILLRDSSAPSLAQKSNIPTQYHI